MATSDLIGPDRFVVTLLLNYPFGTVVHLKMKLKPGFIMKTMFKKTIDEEALDVVFDREFLKYSVVDTTGSQPVY